MSAKMCRHMALGIRIEGAISRILKTLDTKDDKSLGVIMEKILFL